MCRSQYLFLLVAISVSVAQSWDLAVTAGDQLEFYSNQTLVASEEGPFRDLTALAYDAVHNMLLFVDKQSDNASIFSYNLVTKKYQPLVRRRSVEKIQGVAFDPVTRTIFWTDIIDRSIYYRSLKPGSQNSAYGNLLINMKYEIPRGIAVDSCRGYVYWTNTNVTKPTIERAKLDGSERTIIVDTNIYMPVSLVIDQQTKRLYWADDKEGAVYTIESSDLNGNDRITLLKSHDHEPNALTVWNDSIYWIDWVFKTVWSIPKVPTNHTEPKEYITFNNARPFGVVANYKIEDQIKSATECDSLAHLMANKTAINVTFSVPADEGLFCVHGVKVFGKLVCKCNPGFVGDRCDISICRNYCYRGYCQVTDEGEPSCSCESGFIGKRCETEVCYNYCLNNGVCQTNHKQEPVCTCSADFEGFRCENVKPLPMSAQPSTTVATSTTTLHSSTNVVTSTSKDTQLIPETGVTCNCTKEQDSSKSSSMNIAENLSSVDEFIGASSCTDGLDGIMHPGVIVLGIISGLLCIACLVLITKVMQLKKRPRIKKRIIVNKNVTPLTARPDQCEITIENCCNMNICETPCFEPRSTIRPTLLKSKPGKEEKKNLISNMECPDDY